MSKLVATAPFARHVATQITRENAPRVMPCAAEAATMSGSEPREPPAANPIVPNAPSTPATTANAGFFVRDSRSRGDKAVTKRGMTDTAYMTRDDISAASPPMPLASERTVPKAPRSSHDQKSAPTNTNGSSPDFLTASTVFHMLFPAVRGMALPRFLEARQKTAPNLYLPIFYHTIPPS